MADIPVYYPFYNLENEGIRDNLFLVYLDTSNIIFNDDSYRRFLTLRARNAPALDYSINTQTFTWMNQEATYGTGITDIGARSITIEFRETYSPVNVRKLLEDWKTLAISYEFVMNFKRFYTTDMEIEYLYPDLTPFRRFKLHNVFVTDTGAYALGYKKDSNLMSIQAKFIYDYYTELPAG